MREWEEFIPEQERKIYEKAGYKGKDQFGRNPALLIIDVITGFTGTKPLDVMDAIDEFPTSCGKVAWDALPKIEQLLGACRDADVPVIYSTSDPDFKAAFGNATKRGVDATDFEKLATQFPEMIKPQEREFIVRKARASAFRHALDHLSGAQEYRLLIGYRYEHLRLRARHGPGRLFLWLSGFLGRGVCLRPLAYLAPGQSFEMNAKYATVIQLAEALNYVQQLKRLEGRKAIAG